jgi:hypothetical protein
MLVSKISQGQLCLKIRGKTVLTQDGWRHCEGVLAERDELD